MLRPIILGISFTFLACSAEGERFVADGGKIKASDAGSKKDAATKVDGGAGDGGGPTHGSGVFESTMRTQTTPINTTKLITTFAAGSDKATSGEAVLLERSRKCNTTTGCATWTTVDPASATFYYSGSYYSVQWPTSTRVKGELYLLDTGTKVGWRAATSTNCSGCYFNTGRLDAFGTSPTTGRPYGIALTKLAVLSTPLASELTPASVTTDTYESKAASDGNTYLASFVIWQSRKDAAGNFVTYEFLTFASLVPDGKITVAQTAAKDDFDLDW